MISQSTFDSIVIADWVASIRFSDLGVLKAVAAMSTYSFLSFVIITTSYPLDNSITIQKVEYIELEYCNVESHRLRLKK